MTTEKQIIANKKNGKLGGVKTEGGKQISRMNAMKHSFFSKLTSLYDRINHEEFCKEFYEHFDPKNIFESELVEILLTNFLAYRRLCAIESRVITVEWTEETSHIHNPFDNTDSFVSGLFKSSLPHDLMQYAQYKQLALNLIFRTHQKLLEIQNQQNINWVRSNKIYESNRLLSGVHKRTG